jgi:glycosyltransferase involved in cell wall biosynthesis
MATRKANLGIRKKNVLARRYLPLPERFYSGLLHYANIAPYNLLSRTAGDVYIFPNFSRPPMLGRARTVTFIYDLAFARVDSINTERHKKFLDREVRNSVKKSSRIIVCSQNTKNDLVELYNADPESVSVIYPAADVSSYFERSKQEVIAIRKKYNLPDDYILYLGTLEPRKNLASLMEAYDKMPSAIKAEYPLVLVGGQGWLDEEIESTYKRLRGRNTIIRTEYVPEEDKPMLYTGAKLFVYPALYEGFGMPALEAMACGTPVITSNNSSLPEVVGDSGVLVDPSSVDAISNAMLGVLKDSARQRRMANAGLVRAKNFSWASGGKKLKSLLEASVQESER